MANTIVQPTDPGAVGTGVFWLTPSGNLSVRNPDNTGWDAVCLECCTALDTNVYPRTSAGTYPPLGLVPSAMGGFKGISTKFMEYGNLLAQNISQYPTAGLVGEWGDGGVNNCCFPSGGVDYTSGGLVTSVRFTIIGPGTLTVVARQNPIGACGVSNTINLVAKRSGTSTVVDSASGPMGSIQVTIPNDGFCAHYADFNGSGSWGLVSASWVI